MNLLDLNLLLNVTSIVAIIGVAWVGFNSKVKDENFRDLKDRVVILEAILEAERKQSQELHLQNQKAISNLEGQLSTYKEIPLKSIAKSLEAIGESQIDTARTNSMILKRLEASALIASETAHDGGVLVKTEEASPLLVKVKGK